MEIKEKMNNIYTGIYILEHNGVYKVNDINIIN